MNGGHDITYKLPELDLPSGITCLSISSMIRDNKYERQQCHSHQCLQARKITTGSDAKVAFVTPVIVAPVIVRYQLPYRVYMIYDI